MRMSLKPYPKYKPSRLIWLGSIPKHWDEKRAKYLFREVDERSTTGDEELLSVSHVTGVTPRSQKNVTMFKAETYIGHKLCQPGDLVINTMWAWMAALGVAKQRGIVSLSYHVYRPRNPNLLLSEYVDNVLRICAYATEYRIRSTGIRSSRLRLYPDVFLDVPITIPPIEEQKAIVDFLKAKNSEIRHFIHNKRKLIELLDEQKQAIINQAVTQGINRNVRLKPSGVEYLIDIPEHWEVRRLRTVASVRLSGVDKVSVDGEQLVQLCNYVDVYHNDYITDEINFMVGTATSAEIHNCELKAGDVIITKDSESCDDIAVPAYVPNDLNGVVCAYHLALIRPMSAYIEGEYLFWAFYSNQVSNQFRVAANGVTRYGLSQNAIKSAFFPIPPIQEQREIVTYISEKCAGIETAIKRSEREIELIREYRTRLIADVVTGKVDVRGIPVEEIKELEEFEDTGVSEELQESEETEETEEVLDAND